MKNEKKNQQPEAVQVSKENNEKQPVFEMRYDLLLEQKELMSCGGCNICEACKSKKLEEKQ